MSSLIESSYGKFKYILYKPDGDNLPLIVVLHGSGEVGSKLSKLKKREPYLSLKSGKIKLNAVVLMPQLPKSSWGKSATALKKLIDYIITKCNCNITNVSITGHSLGGAGVMDMIVKYPNYFSAAAALSPCKTYTKAQLKAIVHIPLWLFYGEKEGKFGMYARQIKARLDLLGGKAKLTCVKNKGHAIQSCWVESKYGLFNWLVNKGE